ncbi:MAG TPA: uracil-DNA glycosylase [Planctomycetota bacterium]|nr:uracil-DNA glycosylase [Planctomycetota bacterium]
MDLEKIPPEPSGLPFSEQQGESVPVQERFAAYLEDLRRCDQCRLRSGAQRLVPGEGALNAPLMLVGEAPGLEEDRQGRPFVGPSGRLFERTLSKLAVSRGQIYVTNVIKYRTPENRLPRVGEQRVCSGHLRRELDLIRPKVIGALGAIAARALLGNAVRLKDVRGRRIEVMNTTVYPMYHPAFALRNLDRDPQILEIFEADLRRACRDAGLP